MALKLDRGYETRTRLSDDEKKKKLKKDKDSCASTAWQLLQHKDEKTKRYWREKVLSATSSNQLSQIMADVREQI